MTDRLSKEPEPVQGDPTKCVRCGESHEGAVGPRAGTRGWWWLKRLENLPLFAVPCIPLVTAVQEFLAPRMMVRAQGVQGERVNGVYDYAPGVASHVSHLVVRLDAPALVDRVVFALPSVVFAALLAMVSYALWRVEINMTGHTRAYTDKDAQVLGRTDKWLFSGWVAVIALELGASLWFQRQVGDGTSSFPVGIHHDASSLRVRAMVAMMSEMGRVYARGRRAHQELEQGV